MAPLVNWASDKDNKLTRGLMEKTAGIDAKATLPKFHSPHFCQRGQAAGERRSTRPRRLSASARPRSMPPALSITTSRDTGMDARAVLNHIGVETKVAYPGCCGMPFLEQAELARVAEQCRQGVQANCAS